MQSIVESFQGLGEEAARRVVPILVQAQAEIEKELRAWLATKDPQARFTVQRLREALVTIRRGLETIKRTRPALLSGLRVGSRHAGQLATSMVEQELLRFSYLFEGELRIVDIDRAVAIARGDRMVFDRFARSAKRYSGDVRRRVIQELAVGAMRGETMFELSKRLERALPRVFDMAGRRAEMVARTETMNALNVYHNESIQLLAEDDPDIRMRWDATADWRRCSQCASLHGAVVEVDSVFNAAWKSSAGKSMQSTHEHPPAHPNCRCVLVAWHQDWEMDVPKSEREQIRGPHVTRSI